MAISFAKAVKYDAKGRIAIIGPAGSGKSFTMLTAARTLAGPTGKIACIDTEQGSLSKYADQFDFDVCPLDDYIADTFIEAIKQAEKQGYAVFCCDSFSHFWMGRGGTLEFVDAASQRSRTGDSFSGWKEFRPLERAMTDAIIGSTMHVICTMRTKTAYEEQINPKTGKKQRVKIGLAPVQRDGLEYEFDLVGSMTEDNVFVVDKTRCSALAGKAIDKPKGKDFDVFAKWLAGAPKPGPTPPPAAGPLAAAAAAAHPDTNTPAPTPTPTPAPIMDPVWWDLFQECDTLDTFNGQVVPLMKEKGKAFITVAVQEAKRRGYKPDRTTGLYVEGGK